MLTLGSLFDGIGGWCLAAQRSGIKPIWSSEIEKFPMAVTAYHFPDVKQLGDVTLLDGATLPPVDIICAGSPCQDLSIGNSVKREGLAGERSGLFKNSIEIVYRMRNATGGRFPRWFVWENVCGAFHSNSGLDYREVLQEITKANIPMPPGNKWADAGLVQCDGCEVAWRVLDASGWGVPQRRRRIFLVASFGRFRAKEVLLIPQGVYGNIEESQREKQTAPGTVRNSFEKAGGCLTPWDAQGNRVFSDMGVAPTFRTNLFGFVLESRKNTQKITAYDVQTSVKVRKNNVDVKGLQDLLRGALKESGLTKKNIAETLGVPCTEVEHWFRTDKHFSVPNAEIWQKLKNVLGIVTDEYDAQVTEFVWKDCNYDIANRVFDANGLSPTITCVNADRSILLPRQAVRRLTPREAERLQGLPDDWTYLPGSKLCSDSSRYRAIGNGMAQPCSDWILKRIAEVEREDKNE